MNVEIIIKLNKAGQRPLLTSKLFRITIIAVTWSRSVRLCNMVTTRIVLPAASSFGTGMVTMALC